MTRASIVTLTGIAALIAFVVIVSPDGTLEPIVRAEPRSTLPAAADAKPLLNSTHRHREWMTVSISESDSMLAWVMYPERSDRAPVVFLSDERPDADVWTRAVSDQLAAEGYLVVVPDMLTSDAGEIARRLEAVEREVLALPSAQDAVFHVALNRAEGRIQIRSKGPEASFDLSAEAWPDFVAYLNRVSGNVLPASADAAHADHMAMQAQVRGATTGAPRNTISEKHPRLPAGFYTARSTLQNTKLKMEWVDIPMEGTDIKLHTLVVYPATTTRTGVVIVMQHGVGLDEWQRSLAVQVAEDGFIAVAPDLWSGTGPNGGNWDSAEFIDDAMRNAAGKINAAETMRRYGIAREWALRLPQANGKSGSIGFCAGGGNSYRFAAEVPEHNASVVYYGGTPPEEEMAKIKAPVLAFYGENDARVTAAVEPTKAAMARLGKQYEAHVYPKTTHSFVMFQDIGGNNAAIADAWPRTIEFFRKQLN
jgi:carboxymethylenebutenolidase